MEDAPAAILEIPKIAEERKKIEILEEEKFTVESDNNNYIFICSKTNIDSVIFKIILDSEFSLYYYEYSLSSENFNELSRLFKMCNNFEEKYNLLIQNLKQNKKDINIELKDNSPKLKFSLDLPIGTKDNPYINLIKKEKDINTFLDTLKSKFKIIQENQTKLEDKMKTKAKGIHTLLSRLYKFETNLTNKIKEIEEIKSNQQRYIENSQKNENKISEIENYQENILSKLENIEKNENDLEEEDEEKIEISDILNSYSDLENQVKNLIENQEEIEKWLNNNENNFAILNDNLDECQNNVENNIEDINSFKENQLKMQNDINDEKVQIESIKKKQTELENNYNSNDEIIKKISTLIDEVKKDNEYMKKKINDNEKKLVILNKEIQEIKYENINPQNFKFKKNISNNLFSEGVYNNRACIFTSFHDDKVYIAYGFESKSKTFNLNCYDVINDKKFSIFNDLHKNYFDSCRYFLDEEKKRDLIITASLDKHVKVVNFKIEKKSELIFDINFNSKEKEVIINTAYFIGENVMVPVSDNNKGTVKFYSLDSNYIGEIEENVGFILGLSKYFCEKKKKYYILISNSEGIYAYNLEGLDLHNKFIPAMENKETKKYEFNEAYVIEKDDNKFILVGPCLNFGYLFFWDFFHKNCIYEIETNRGISDICLWNNNYIFAALHSGGNQFILMNADTKKIEKKFPVRGLNELGGGIKILRHKTKGDYLIVISLNGKLDLYTLR